MNVYDVRYVAHDDMLKCDRSKKILAGYKKRKKKWRVLAVSFGAIFTMT